MRWRAAVMSAADLVAHLAPSDQKQSNRAKIPPGVAPHHPQTAVLFGATGDLARRKLMPGLFHLASVGFIPGFRIVGVSVDVIDADGFRAHVRRAGWPRPQNGAANFA